MIRVLRILEYVYADNKRAEEDMARWQVPATGTQRHGNMIIRSSIITDLDFKFDDIPDDRPDEERISDEFLGS
jgi:hypothetical protein